jgi:hypothetical protein
MDTGQVRTRLLCTPPTDEEEARFSFFLSFESNLATKLGALAKLVKWLYVRPSGP